MIPYGPLSSWPSSNLTHFTLRFPSRSLIPREQASSDGRVTYIPLPLLCLIRYFARAITPPLQAGILKIPTGSQADCSPWRSLRYLLWSACIYPRKAFFAAGTCRPRTTGPERQASGPLPL